MHSWDSVVYMNKSKRDVQGTDILSGFLYNMDERMNHEPLKDIKVEVSICLSCLGSVFQVSVLAMPYHDRRLILPPKSCSWRSFALCVHGLVDGSSNHDGKRGGRTESVQRYLGIILTI